MSDASNNEIFPLTKQDILRIVNISKAIDSAEIGDVIYKTGAEESDFVLVEFNSGFYDITIYSHKVRYFKKLDYALHIELARMANIPVPEYKIIEDDQVELTWDKDTLKWYYGLVLKNKLSNLKTKREAE